ncbi:hypothetical protein HKX48_000371 [Thoreauomyces humboldtii]|nr:hypothetical protein HKX48_000371 [Thoreauomyces humboldtii]
MTFYQIWGHGLFPKLRFESLAERCEVVCRERRMRIFFDAVLSEERRRRVEDAEQQREDDSRRDQEDGEDGMDVDDGSHHRDEDTPALEYPSDGDEDEEAPAMDETINDDVDERVRGMMDSPPRSSRSRPPSPPSSAPRLAPLFSAVPAPTPVPPLNVTAPPPADEPGSVAHSAAVMEKMAANKAKALAKLAERRRIREEMERQEEEAARELAE